MGEALARQFAAEGATVALVARSADAISKLAADLGGSSHPADLADPAQVATLVHRVEDEAGPGLPIGTTVVELGPIPTDMLDHVDDYEPTAKSFRRFYRLRLLVDVPRQKVAEQVVEAVQKNRRHVRIPKRAVLFPMLAEAPRRIVELLLSGVRPRPR